MQTRDESDGIHDPVDDLDEALEPDEPLQLLDPNREAAIAAM